MDWDSYQRWALTKVSVDARRTLHNQRMHSGFMLASEAGEVLGILQKDYQGQGVDDPATRLKLLYELGDVLFALAELGDAFDFTLSQIKDANIEKLNQRYEKGYTVDEDRNSHPVASVARRSGYDPTYRTPHDPAITLDGSGKGI